MIEIFETCAAPETAYDRQVLIDGWDQDRLRRAKVMVVGAGAIGNEVLKNLALLGFGNLFIVDFDTISPSNLSRTVLFRPDEIGHSKARVAADRVRDLCIEPTAQVTAWHGDLVWELGTGVFRAMNLVVGCVDNVEARLAINRQCHLAGVPWIDAGIYELDGHVTFFAPGESACYRCGLSPRQLAESRRRYSCDDFKRLKAQDGEAPTVQVTSAVVAAIQAQEAAKYLCGIPVNPGVRIHFRGTLNDLTSVPLKRRADCTAHATYPHIEELAVDTSATLRHLLLHVSKPEHCGDGAALDLRSERSFVLRARCRQCGRWVDMYLPRFAIFENDAWCSDCAAGEPRDVAPGVTTEVEELSLFRLGETPEAVLDRTLKEIGVPLLGVLPVLRSSGDYHYYELTGDRSQLAPGCAPTELGNAPVRQED